MPTKDKVLTLFDPSTKNAQLQKIIAKYISDCFEIAGLLKVESQCTMYMYETPNKTMYGALFMTSI